MTWSAQPTAVQPYFDHHRMTQRKEDTKATQALTSGLFVVGRVDGGGLFCRLGLLRSLVIAIIILRCSPWMQASPPTAAARRR